ncbi:Mitochondrial oxaloacetate transport protein [Cyberlindnera fabianii]|uniref:Mitochondrial oxaloacetate transport protein n=1 Tax=Cyberlindnera fabianii TaxID=36022 RepID=A0A1V2LDJ9_CYBFA|nr:Mitochondrial oxaloacetate transport protein [Cyberlindnera fabianii]
MSESKSQPQKSASQQVSTLGGFIAGGLAACGAVTFTNPIELVKTRMQLQGELSLTATKVYTNPGQALVKIYKNEGIRGLQKGLFCAYVYQIGLNGCRLGLYEPVRNAANSIFFPSQDPATVQSVPVNVIAGAVSGMAGAVIGSPLFLIKTRMQSYTSSGPAVGDQTHYKNTWDGLKQIVQKDGFKGLFRGVDAAIIRTGMGSSVQLPIYNYVKHFLQRHDLVKEGPALHLCSSVCAGLGVGVVMNPGDVVLTRMYNQKGHSNYKGPIDCFVKTVKAEGPGALYKGFGAQLLRIAPHTVLTLTFMEQTMGLMRRLEQDVFKL